MDELLRHICDADSVQEIEQFGSVLVQRLWLARQRRSDITAQEMKAVMEERDSSTAKVSLFTCVLRESGRTPVFVIRSQKRRTDQTY